MYYKLYPKTDRERLRVIALALNASCINLHAIKLPLILEAEAGFFISWFEHQLASYTKQGKIDFSEHMRTKSDKIIHKLWKELEHQMRVLPEAERMKKLADWGVKLIDVRYKRLDPETLRYRGEQLAEEAPILKFRFLDPLKSETKTVQQLRRV